ncbi:hypothetical protein I553_1688 [Mycobacterium xenopi 4042]|uniref:Uncharacterized protein n=1 Tax=Mycobacterium xenopi 4042 TaxID=1299334 RepID=X8CGX0_MYCXE|nr:hypothetical protein I552_5488 [Mycobacterium xenopi 3993]EUA54530.1 hypothetical protein I553_1688 [Mycobacterium xenopi 4042]
MRAELISGGSATKSGNNRNPPQRRQPLPRPAWTSKAWPNIEISST